MSRDLLIRNARLMDPARGVDDRMDLLIREGLISAVGQFDADDVTPSIDAEHLLLCPGFVDLCAHFREPGEEHKASIRSEGIAAAAGGITTVFHTPDTLPVADTPAVVQLITERAQKEAQVRLIPIGALTRGLNGEDLSEMESLKRAGCRAVSNAHKPIRDALVLRRALEYAASHDLLVVVRPEDCALVDMGCVHEGFVSTAMGLRGIPDAAETVAVAQVLALIELTGAKVHFGRLSSAKAVRSIARAQEKGMPVTADVAIHQLHLTEEAVKTFDPNAHVRPPFRTLSDRDALRKGIRDGVITAVCSDHRPHEPNAKLDAFPSTEPGVASLETLLPLLLQLVELEEISLMRAIELITSGPSKIMGLEAGSLEVGARADFCLVDPEMTWEVTKDNWHSAGFNTPFWGQTFRGRVVRTFQAGREVFSLFREGRGQV